MADFLRHDIENQPPEVRRHNFEEVSLGFSDDVAKKEAERCLNCKNAPCRSGCPVGVNIPKFIGFIKCGDMENAVKSLKGDNSLPSVCGRVCPQEKQCELHCVRREKAGGSVSVGGLERYVGDFAIKQGKALKTLDKIGKKSQLSAAVRQDFHAPRILSGTALTSPFTRRFIRRAAY